MFRQFRRDTILQTISELFVLREQFFNEFIISWNLQNDAVIWIRYVVAQKMHPIKLHGFHLMLALGVVYIWNLLAFFHSFMIFKIERAFCLDHVISIHVYAVNRCAKPGHFPVFGVNLSEEYASHLFLEPI